MKKYFQYYLIVWAIVLVIFNIIVWVVPNELYGFQKTSGGFWPGYIFINIAILGMLPCGLIASRSENKDRLFLNLPILNLSFTALIMMFIAGTVCMAVPGISDWVGLIICLAILGITIIAIVSAKAAASMVGGIDDKVKGQTMFIKSLAADAKGLMNEAESDIAKAETKTLYEVIRYSDPMSAPALAGIDSQITIRFDAFTEAVRTGKDEAVENLSKVLQILIKDRNNKCKLYK